jgi:hypothetical protein
MRAWHRKLYKIGQSTEYHGVDFAAVLLRLATSFGLVDI